MPRVAILLLAFASWSAGADEVAAGRAVYEQTCIACHGAKGKSSIPGVANLAQSDGALSKTDEELFGSIKNGLQSPGAALAMPAKGGNPGLQDADIMSVLKYLRAEFQR